MTTLESIDLVFHRRTPDGREVEVKATISPDYGFQQWGAEVAILGDNVDALTAIEEALNDQWSEANAR